MSVYVDRVELAFGRMVMCHMIADTPDELHAMADRIGVARRWFQQPPKASFWHYDIAKSKRELAVAAGAIDSDRNAFVAALRRIRESRVFEAGADREWVGRRCGIVSPLEPSSAADYPVGSEEPCVLCDSPVDKACVARVRRKEASR